MIIPVKLEVFEGPLDLLLHLIDKNKLNIYDIPIVEVTDQYMEALKVMEENKMEIMSDFIEMAATLINIKAKMLLPAPSNENEENIDPRQELMEKLIEYRKFKLIASKLKEQQVKAGKIVFKQETIPEEVKNYVPPVDPNKLLSDVDFSKLYKIYQSVMKKMINKVDPIRSKFGDIKKENITVQDKMDYIKEIIYNNKKINFRELLEEQSTKVEVIVTFLAILELMKIGYIEIIQEGIFNNIIIHYLGRDLDEGSKNGSNN